MDGPPALAERKGGGGGVFSLPPGQSDEFSRLKAEGRLCFLGAPWSPWSLEATGTSPQLITGGDFTPDPEFKKTEPRSVYEICAYFFFFFFVFSQCEWECLCELFSWRSAGLCWHAAARYFQGEQLRKCPWHVLCTERCTLPRLARPAVTNNCGLYSPFSHSLFHGYVARCSLSASLMHSSNLPPIHLPAALPNNQPFPAQRRYSS